VTCTRPQPNKHCYVRALSHKVKCGCRVQRIRTNINNLTASKHAAISCYNFCIVQESGIYFFTIRPQCRNVAFNLMNTNTRPPRAGCIDSCTQNYRPLIVWQFCPIFGATLFCSIKWKTLSFKRHCTRFTGSHTYACSHSARMLNVLRLLALDLCEPLQILCFIHSA